MSDLSRSLNEIILESKCEIKDDVYRKLELEMDKICLMWDEDRSKVKKLEKENAQLKDDLEYANKERDWLMDSILKYEPYLDKSDLESLMVHSLEEEKGE